MKKLRINSLFLIFILFITLFIPNSYGNTGDEDLSFLSEIFGGVEIVGNNNGENNNTYSDEFRVSAVDKTYSNETELTNNNQNEVTQYSPWGDDETFLELQKLKPDLENEIKVSKLPTTGPTEIFLLLLSLIISGVIFYKKRKM